MTTFERILTLKTLLVDDDPIIRDSLSLAFKCKGGTLHAVATAEEGLKMLQNEAFDIVISDLKLPGMDGLAFLKQAAVGAPHCLKVLISAFGDEEVVGRAAAIGVHRFLAKPFGVHGLLDALASSLAHVV